MAAVLTWSGYWLVSYVQCRSIWNDISVTVHLKFHLKQHFSIYISGERQYTTFRQQSNQRNSTVRHFSSSFVACPVIIQKNAFQSADSLNA